MKKKQTAPWQPPTAAEIHKFWRDCVDDMLDIRRNYALNREFFLGNQWLKYNEVDMVPELLDFGSLKEADDRVTVNKIRPRTLSLLARLTNTPLAFEPRPQGIDQQAQQQASLQKQILDHEAHRNDWEQIRADMILDCLFGAVAAIAAEPDWEYSDHDTITDPDTGGQLRLPTRPTVKLTALSALEFGIEPGTRKLADARRWVRATTLTPEQAQDRYELAEKPAPSVDSMWSSVMHRSLADARRGSGTRRSVDVCMVLVYYERPTNTAPGCVLHVIGNEVVRQSPWPFPFRNHLNLAVFAQTPLGGTWRGDTFLNDARQLQRNYNRAWTSVNRHIGKADNARLLLPNGAVIEDDGDFTGDVGEIVRFDANVGAPQWMQAPQIPRWLREHIEKIETELDDQFSTHAVTRGQAPGDRNSGLALSILAEKDETPLGPMAKNQQRGWQVLAEMVLDTMRHMMAQVDTRLAQFGQEPMQVSGVIERDDGTPDQVTWSAAELPAGPVVHVPLEAVTPRSQAAIQDMMIRLAQSFPAMFEGLSPQQLATVIRTPETTSFASVMTNPQIARARWENNRMLAGAGDVEVEIAEFDDDTMHIDTHNEMRMSAAYRTAAPEVREFIDTHIAAHEQVRRDKALEALTQQMQMQAMAQQAAPMPDQMSGPPAGEPQDPQVAEVAPA